MACYIAFLRGINVGGKNKVPMAELREMCADLGLQDAKTLLQSGNLVFKAAKKKPDELEKLLEKETAKRFGITIDYMVITSEELASAIKENPIKKEVVEDPSHLLVLFLKKKAVDGAEKALAEAIKGREAVKVFGQRAYAIFPDGIGTSKLTNVVIDKKLGTSSTARNWNTVTKLLALAQE